MTQALSGIRIIDLTTGPAAGIATMVLADFGADVLSITRPDGDVLSTLAASKMWKRGKRELCLDLSTEQDLEDLHSLCAAADVLLCNWRASALARKGLDYNSLHQRHPHLIFCHITGFGNTGPKADYPGYEHVVAASTGRMRSMSGLTDRKGPSFSALQVATHATAQTAASGILAALLERGDDGEGRLVETSIAQGMMPYEMAPVMGSQFPELFAEIIPAEVPDDIVAPPLGLFYHPFQTADGRWMQFGNLLPHLFDHFLVLTDLIDLLADPDYNQAQMMLPEPKQEEFRGRMMLRMQERTADEWLADCVADGGIVATIHQTTQQAMQDPDILANGHVIKQSDGSLQIGPVARLQRTPAAPGEPCIDDGESENSWKQQWINSPRAKPSRAPSKALPLKGVRVVEIATIIAAPLGASFLADMGAEVIKVEPVGGDPFRGMLGGLGSSRVNGGKRSISVNLKSEKGREIVLDLLKDADAMIHNFRPGVPERLGIGYEQVEAINPSIVYLQSNGYGPDGPGAQRPSTHPVPGAAMGGVLYQMGEHLPSELLGVEELRLWTRRLMHANDVNPDPNTAVVVATSIMLGLVARQRTGHGQQILIDMFGTNAYANSDDFINYEGKPNRPLPDPALLGLSPTYRLYPCAGRDWVFLALVSDREKTTFVSVMEDEGLSGPSLESLRNNDEQTAQFLEQLFATNTSDYWEGLFAGNGLGCVQANHMIPREFWLEDPQSKSM
ncbi:MAG: CoA transferase, partial [Pseudomonadota bacterium]